MSSVHRFTTVLLALTFAVSALALDGQQSSSAFTEVLRTGDDVRLAAPGVSIEDATVVRVRDDSLVVARGGQQWSLSTASIQRLDVRRRQTGRWAARGAIGGFGMGVVSNVFASGLCDSCGASSWVAGAAGAAVFGALGAAIGSRNFRWDPVIGGSP